MARPTTKEDLINRAEEQYKKLLDLIDSISENDRLGEFKFDVENKKEAHWERDKNIKDVLVHLYEWHNLLLDWIESNQNEDVKQFLKEGYNWKTYENMNIEFWKKHQNTSFDKSLKILEDSHKNVIELVNTFSDEELFYKNIFKWVGGSTLGSYFVSATSSHYDWAIKKIKEYKKSIN